MNNIELIKAIKLNQENLEIMNKTNNIVKDNIINLTNSRNLKQKEVAEAINMKASNFNRALNNDGTSFTNEQINEIANFLNVNSNVFYDQKTYVEIVGELTDNWVLWHKPYVSSEYLQLPHSIIDVINSGNNDSTDANLKCLHHNNIVTIHKATFNGQSAVNQFVLFDANRTTVLDDCHSYLCVIDIKHNVHKDKSSPKKYNDLSSFVAEIYIENDNVICQPYHDMFGNYTFKKKDVTLCSPIFYRTMHKNIVKTAKELQGLI